MEYSDYNDYELIEYISEGNEEANNIIIKKYEPLINSIASKLYKKCKNNGIEYNDLVQEGFIALDYSLKHFVEEKNTVFFTYVKTCIERKLLSYLLSTTRKKHQALNDSVSFDNDDCLLDKVLTDKLNNPEVIIESIEAENDLIKRVKKKLTSFEEQVFYLMISNFDYKEISDFLEKDKKAITNAIQRIRIKVREAIEEKKLKDQI